MAPAKNVQPTTEAVGHGHYQVEKTDLKRWRLEVDHGRHVWHYLDSEQACVAWPQTDEDRYWLGLGIDAPTLPTAKTPLDSARNGFAFYRRIQAKDGHWSSEYGGPLFLMPGLLIGMYVTQTPIPEPWRIEMTRYLLNKANEDGGWGLHVAGPSTVFGTACNYVAARILGLDAEHPAMVKARATLHKLGGATGAPSWGKFWLSILGVYDWEGVNPVPPELWCLPDWLPIHPWRWWIHTRMVYIPMGYLWAKRFSAPVDPLIESLRNELYTEPYDDIDWPSHRNNVAEIDVFAPHTKTLDGLMALLGVYESCGGIPPLRRAGIKRAYDLLCMEDENTGYQCLGPVNKMLNYVCRWVEEGAESKAMALHREKLKDFLWLGPQGMMMCGTNGSQLWDTSFIAQAMVDSGLVEEPANKAACAKVLDWLDDCQIRDNPKYYKECYRYATKGAWPFSTKEQGYTVSDCTGEGMKATIMLQETAKLPRKISQERLRQSVDVILGMQNKSGGFASYEPINAPHMIELLNPAEVFGDIMREYDYPECTTSVVTALQKFKQTGDEYRRKEIDTTIKRAIGYILSAQQDDGSWFGSWAVCHTYATLFALESLHLDGQSYENSEPVKRACDLLISKQSAADGGWSEDFTSCVEGRWIQGKRSNVVQTSWALIALLHAQYPHVEPLKRAARLIMSRQQPDGSWKNEEILGVFNRNCAIDYCLYPFCFSVWALGKANRYLVEKGAWP
ncbi:putative lanosterol synthase [Acaromyces ingoldii]|uniref:Terpene cyclase/mutase family member n=1 Tax=Acaromyces ingoldii TaxID=215250 RepID=A0A316YDY1_9BASI|nr:putative lanosterol synthase [Acaromyces ingoldii]PWN87412.1 putative lanosterol synthase [Acaromyces ingoldii]